MIRNCPRCIERQHCRHRGALGWPRGGDPWWMPDGTWKGHKTSPVLYPLFLLYTKNGHRLKGVFFPCNLVQLFYLLSINWGPLCAILYSRLWGHMCPVFIIPSGKDTQYPTHRMSVSYSPLCFPSHIQCPSPSRSSVISNCLGQQDNVAVNFLAYGIHKTWVQMTTSTSVLCHSRQVTPSFWDSVLSPECERGPSKHSSFLSLSGK